jgi:beta-lactamase class A
MRAHPGKMTDSTKLVLVLSLLLAAGQPLVRTDRAGAQQPAASPASARNSGGDLRSTLEGMIAAHEGVVGIGVRHLGTGESLSIRGDETFPSASLIKVAVLVTLLDEVEKGRVRLDERSTMIGRDRVGGDGVLKHMASGTTLTLGDLAWLMIVLSDNTATNLLLDKVDIRTVWGKMEALGLPQSKIHSKTFRRETSVAMDSSVKYGLGVATPDEILRLFELLHQGRAVSSAMDSLALTILAGSQDDALITRMLPPGTRVAHKSGAVDRARNDCGIMYTPAAPVALCFMTRENTDTGYGLDNAAYLLAARIASAVYAHYNASAR